MNISGQYPHCPYRNKKQAKKTHKIATKYKQTYHHQYTHLFFYKRRQIFINSCSSLQFQPKPLQFQQQIKNTIKNICHRIIFTVNLYLKHSNVFIYEHEKHNRLLPFHIVRIDYYHIRIRHSFRSIRSCAYIIHIRNINNDSLNMCQRLECLQKKLKIILAEYSLSMRPFALSDRFQTSGKFVQYRKFLPITTICLSLIHI